MLYYCISTIVQYIKGGDFVAWSFDGKSPVSLQIASIIRIDIVSGKYKAGEQIPTVRQLACDASVNPNTMQKALSILESEGLLVTKSTNGRFVTEDASAVENALANMQKEYLKKVVARSRSLNISKEAFIEFIENYYERNDDI